MLTAIGTFVVGQRQGKAEFVTAVAKASDIVISRLTKECDRMEAARVVCEKSHQECRAELESVRQQIWDLMHREPVPQYQSSDLKRVGKSET